MVYWYSLLAQWAWKPKRVYHIVFLFLLLLYGFLVTAIVSFSTFHVDGGDAAQNRRAIQFDRRCRDPRGRKDLRSQSTNNPLVCIVIPTTDAHVEERYITIESAINQTYDYIEIVTVEAGFGKPQNTSVDNYFESLSASKNIPFHSIDLLHRRGPRVGQMANIGISACPSKSEFVIFLSAGNAMEDNAVSTMVTQSVLHDAEIIMADFDIVNETAETAEFSQQIEVGQLLFDSLPSNEIFNAMEHPDVLLASASLGQIMFRHDRLQELGLEFPDGDHLFSESGFYWENLLSASRCLKIDDVLFRLTVDNHIPQHEYRTEPRSELEKVRRQTTAAELGGMLSIMNIVGRKTFQYGKKWRIDRCKASNGRFSDIVARFFAWIHKSSWIISFQSGTQMREKMSRRICQIQLKWKSSFDSLNFLDGIGESTSANLEQCLSQREQVDLSIVMPLFDVAELIGELLETMYSQLSFSGFRFEVFAVDDGSTDGTFDMLLSFAQMHPDSFVVMSTPGQIGAGKSRNLAIPLVEGDYTFFVDPDDGYDFRELAKAVQQASKHRNDLVMLPYRLEYRHSKKADVVTDMFASDRLLWDWVHNMSSPGQPTLREAALGLIGYPWKQVTSTRLLHDAEIFFGQTSVHNDVQFHWLSVAASMKIAFHPNVICTHRKFESSIRGQLSQGKSKSRMAVVDALGSTQISLAKWGHTDSKDSLLPLWRNFSISLLSWAQSRVPDDSLALYSEQKDLLLAFLNGNRSHLPGVREWTVWRAELYGAYGLS